MQNRKLKRHERSARELELVEMIGKTADTTAQKTYYDELFKSLRPVMYTVFSRVGAPRDYNDLWQEMYFALKEAVEAYLDPTKAVGVPFTAIAMTRFNQYVCGFYRRFYKTNQKTKPPVSLNGPIKSNVDGATVEMIDTIADPADDYEAVLNKIHNDEKAGLDAVLWAEVDKLPPKQAAAIKERFIDGRKVEGHILSAKDAAFLHQVNKGLERLRRNSAVRHIARVYDVLQDSSTAYSGSFESFKNSMMSSVERAALLNEREAERKAQAEKYAYRADSRQFSLREQGILKDVRLIEIEKVTGISRGSFRNLRNGKSACRNTCLKLLQYFGKPDEAFDEMFIDITPSVYCLKARCFTIMDTSMLFSAGKETIGKAVGVSGRTIANLREGKDVTREVAEKVATWAGRPFDELFKPVGGA